LSAFFDSAIRDELREDNPAHNVFRKSRTKTARMKARPRVGESVKAMTATERDRFLTAALAIAPQWFTAWTLMALAGLRRNEALGLRWGSVRLAARQIVVREQLDAGSTKSSEARVVDLAEPPPSISAPCAVDCARRPSAAASHSTSASECAAGACPTSRRGVRCRQPSLAPRGPCEGS
jgi:hypothetical protein